MFWILFTPDFLVLGLSDVYIESFTGALRYQAFYDLFGFMSSPSPSL